MPDLWIAIALDPVSEECLLLGMDDSESESIKARAGDAPYRKSFKVGDSIGPELLAWFRQCGVAHSDAVQLVQGFGRELRAVLDEAVERKGAPHA